MTAPARPGWRRLWRPSHPLFWLMLFFNVLSSLGAWAMRILPLSDLGLLVTVHPDACGRRHPMEARPSAGCWHH